MVLLSGFFLAERHNFLNVMPFCIPYSAGPFLQKILYFLFYKANLISQDVLELTFL